MKLCQHTPKAKVQRKRMEEIEMLASISIYMQCTEIIECFGRETNNSMESSSNANAALACSGRRVSNTITETKRDKKKP